MSCYCRIRKDLGRLFCTILALMVTSTLALAAEPVPFVWIESEKPGAGSFPSGPAGTAHPEWLSGEKWLFVNVEVKDVAKAIPANGAVFRYPFVAPTTGNFEVWNRAGMEHVRSPFEWRIDAGDWTMIQPRDPKYQTIDLMEMSTWTEIGWLKMGQRELTKGEHTLEIRIPAPKDAKGNPDRVLYASDCICLSAGPFHPHSKFKTGEADRNADDEKAAKQVFTLPTAAAASERSTVSLEGTWEICRHDELMPTPVAEPMTGFPDEPRWKAIAVPGDKNARPELLFAHRLWYRCRVDVPASLAGRSFVLTFPQNSLNTTVVVNGVPCGFGKHPFVHFDIDATKGIKPGQVNEIRVGIRDYWYAYSASPTNPMKLRDKFNLPPDFARMGFQDLAYPVWGSLQSGILVTPTLTACGSVYSSDVFVKPSTAEKKLAVEVTVANPTDKEAKGEVLCEAIDPKTGAVAKALPAKAFAVPAGKESTVEVSAAWSDPILWWPDAPHLYELRTTVKVGDQPGDVRRTTFGFRQWGIDGKHFTLNGIRWRGWNMGVSGNTPEEWLESYRKTNQTTMRMSGATQGGPRPFFGMAPDQALDWMDRNGVPVRRCGILDGEMIGSMAIENDPELKKLYNSEIKMDLMNNWVEQMAAQVKGERNHPSIQIWSIENEWLFINCINLYGGLMDQFEAQMLRCTKAVQAVDPTRSVMTDGGGANKDQSMPVHGNHYVALDNPGALTAYPGMAYQPNPTAGGRGRWVWDEKRPRYLGEDFFFTGNHPELATIGGEAATTGKSSTLKACGLVLSILQQGYRWADFAAWDFYVNPGDADDSQWRFFAPRAALCREWDWTFQSGKQIKRTIGLFNDSHHPDPMTFTWELTIGGKKLAGESKEYRVPPGMREVVEISLPIPAVAVRNEGELVLSLSANGKELFRDTKAVSVLNPTTSAPKGDAKLLAVFDPAGTAQAALKVLGIPFISLADLKALPEEAKVLLIGKDALDATESTSSRLAAFASTGRAVVVLDQQHPLKFQALPAEIEATTEDGRVGFAEDPGHPAFRNLQDKDFFTWGSDEKLYRNAYRKPTRGARSLLQCGDTLRNSGLVEVPTGKGVMLLCQLLVGEKMEGNAPARQLLANLIDYGSTYKQLIRPVAAAVGGAPLLAKTLDAVGVKYSPAADPLAALAPGGIAVVLASAENLKLLADHPAKVEEFFQSGGWIVLNGLTPDGFANYNKLVGWDHVIRPFTLERVAMAATRRPIMAGITGGDVAMYSSKQIFAWTAGNYVVDDEFKFVIDYDEIAPFCRSPFYAYDKIVNGFTSADGWPLIINFQLNKDRSPYDIEINFPREEIVTEFTWIGNISYWPQTKLELIFDGDPKRTRSFDVKPIGDPQALPVNETRKAKKMTLRIAGWREVPGKDPLIGIDNIYIQVQRPPEFYERVKPLLNVGGMMEYPRGKGGILLCNLNFKESEEVPLNADKKRSIFSALLRNLNAPFSTRTLIAGANLEYAPIDLSKQATAFRDEKGWFGDTRFTFRDLPKGKQTMSGVPYDIYDFATSPVPTVVMIDGPGVPGKLPTDVKGIPVNRKADALFFLLAARLDRRRNPDEIKNGAKFELARFAVHYADGKVEEVPVYGELQVEDYRQKTPVAVPGAQLAWTRPYEGTDQSAAAYSIQWTNPRPDVAIATIDLLPGKDKAGVPALLAVTAATGR